MKKNENQQRSSIKRKLIVIPLIVVLITLFGIGYASTYFIRISMLNQMSENGYYVAEQFIARLEDNARSVERIDQVLEEKIRGVGNVVIGNKDNISDAFLVQLVNQLDLHRLHWWDNEEKMILHSATEGFAGLEMPEGHVLHDFMASNETEIIEDVRQSVETNESFKFGYVKSPDGRVIQVGIAADTIQEITENFSYQRLVEDLASTEEVIFATFIDRNLQAIAHSDRDRIDMVFDNEGFRTAAIDGKPYSSEYDYDAEGITVFDVSFPVIIDGEHLGAISIGFSMENVNAAISRNIMAIILSGVFAFIILGTVLFSSSNNAVKTLKKLKEQVYYMSKGDFSVEIPKELLDKKDEFGEISNALKEMQNSMKEMIQNILDTSQQVASSSEELTATSQQSSASAEEVAKTVEEIAKGALDQAKDTEQGAIQASELGELVEKEKTVVNNLNLSVDEVSKLKDEGLEILKDLVEKTKLNNKSTNEVQEVIINTNASAEKIEGASQMIRNIAEQTNLLALNASIEAARAGEAGRGFTVVANEIRKLAEQSNKFTEEIASIINELTEKTSFGVSTMEEVEKIVNSQTESVERTNIKFEGIANAIEKIKKAIEEVNESGMKIENKKDEMTRILENLSAIAEENAASTEEISASAEEQTASMVEIANSSEDLAKQAEKMQESITRFKI